MKLTLQDTSINGHYYGDIELAMNPSEIQRQVEEMKNRTADQCIDAVFEELGGRSGLDIRENTNYDDEIEAEIKMALKIRFKKIFG